jgi:hypothetical protein
MNGNESPLRGRSAPALVAPPALSTSPSAATILLPVETPYVDDPEGLIAGLQITHNLNNEAVSSEPVIKKKKKGKKSVVVEKTIQNR